MFGQKGSLGHVSFTNLKCEMIDRKFGKFEVCHIKAVNRTHKYIDMELTLYKLPISNMMIKVEPMRHGSGYRPFFMSMKYDFCKYMRNPNLGSLIFLRDLHLTFINATNLNHTCPYDHNISITKFWTGDLEAAFLKYLPVPNGDYAMYSTWSSSNIPRLFVNIYFKITN
ncbi:uncharacterized protein LOC108034429 [Drosophila biarmipes]|uniref:uncharacterized protein LOC108034429 n=1 Tax=Drosophila biarmipes TaxID=125945 RepID=UPI0021CCEDAE|nr:uncharacterized protein LOC108034429 [Drosophila biarmipes]